MSYFTRKLSIFISLSVIAFLSLFNFFSPTPSTLHKIAIANYGPHVSLEETIQGITDELVNLGFNNQQVQFEIVDVNFESNLIPQMLSKLKASQPKVLVTLTTPVTQNAKNSIKTIPIVFSSITEPVSAGLLTSYDQPAGNLTGASDMQDLSLFLKFATSLLPKSKKIGLLYASGEANDLALVNMLLAAAKLYDMHVIALPVEHPRDIPMRMQIFKDKVDFIYVGVSGPIQPSLPAIVSEADRMNIPVFNADLNAVKAHQVLGSYGVSYYQVGVNTAHIIAQLLNGITIDSIKPVYPKASDHHGYVSQKKMEKYGIRPSYSLQNITIVQ